MTLFFVWFFVVLTYFTSKVSTLLVLWKLKHWWTAPINTVSHASPELLIIKMSFANAKVLYQYGFERKLMLLH